MPLTLDSLLINQEDFKNFRDISINTDGDRINAYIRESQMKEIRDFLGEALYFLLIGDYTVVPNAEGTFATARFEKLWYGDTYTSGNYTIQFGGLKPAHVYYGYERFLYNQSLNVTRYGRRILEDDELSTNLPISKKYEVSADSMGLLYQSDARRYLDAMATTYPEWRNPEQKTLQTTGLKMMKVGKLIGR